MGALEPEGSGWNPKVPVESEDSGERPKMLGWLLTHLENRSSPLHGVARAESPRRLTCDKVAGTPEGVRLKPSDSGGILEMPDESFIDRWSGVWPNLDFRRSRMFVGRCQVVQHVGRLDKSRRLAPTSV